MFGRIGRMSKVLKLKIVFFFRMIYYIGSGRELFSASTVFAMCHGCNLFPVADLGEGPNPFI